jgi:Flp pilus assembly protein TadD
MMTIHWLKGWLVVGISAAAVGCASVGGPPPETSGAMAAPGALEVAQNALAEERYRHARSWYQKVLQAEPHNERAKLGLAETWLGDGQRQNAMTLFEELVPSPAVGAEALQGKGIALLADGEGEAAGVALRAAVARDARLWRAWNALGLLFDGKQDWAAAADAYAKAAAAAPGSAVPHNNWGVSLMTQKRYAEAAEQFARAIALAPDSEATKTNLRLALAFQGRYAEAMAGVQQEDVPTLLNNIGYVAMLRGEKDRAKAYFLRSMELSPNYNQRAARNLQTLEGVESASVY